MLEYTTTFFPLVIVTFKGSIDSYEELEDFYNYWKKLYDEKKEFIFLFDTSEIGFVNVKYCYELKKIIDKIRLEPIQYLKKSIIVVSNVYVKQLLNLIFKITTPVAPVYIYNNSEDKITDINRHYIDLLNLIESDKLDKFKIINSN